MMIYMSAASHDITTLDMTGLLDHIRVHNVAGERPRRYVGTRRNVDPHPALVAMIAVGGLLAVCAFWALVAIGIVSLIFP